MMVMMAVIYRESGFNPHAHSEAEAYGLTQMTQVAVTMAERECKLPRLRQMSRLYDSFTAVRYGSCYLDYAMRMASDDVTGASILYNGGVLTLTRYQRGENINSESANYALQIVRVLQQCEGNGMGN